MSPFVDQGNVLLGLHPRSSPRVSRGRERTLWSTGEHLSATQVEGDGGVEVSHQNLRNIWVFRSFPDSRVSPTGRLERNGGGGRTGSRTGPWRRCRRWFLDRVDTAHYWVVLASGMTTLRGRGSTPTPHLLGGMGPWDETETSEPTVPYPLTRLLKRTTGKNTLGTPTVSTSPWGGVDSTPCRLGSVPGDGVKKTTETVC